MTLVRVPAGKKRCSRTDADIGPLFDRVKCRAPGEWQFTNGDGSRWCFAHMLDRLDSEVQQRRRAAFRDGEFTFIRPSFCGGIVLCRRGECRPDCYERCRATANIGDEAARRTA